MHIKRFFNLDDARKTVETAIKNDPDNALAYARLSELWLSSGELDNALQAAEKAAELNPNIARTQTVLGFANLTRINIPEAIQAFNKAIELDQATPLPRLGLGLARIRKGELEAGREDIAIAVSLDPLNSLFRSYLGKAYYEEKRDQLAAPQYDLAKMLDPFDPTPWFYDALRKQAQNQPVEALQDLQQSIELNNNRAVYRSQLLLDEDDASRSTSLARVYEDLGFEQIALVEGAKSVASDPTNYSAHRFLSDIYAKLPRHEIARDSELLQAQLLQPININPVQPRLSDDDVAFLDDVGLGKPGFNEFTPLFASNQVRLYGSTLLGGNETIADNVIVSGIHDNLSYSIGQFHFETAGFRENNHVQKDIYNGFVQANLSPQTSLQFEFRSIENESGYSFVWFDQESLNPNYMLEKDANSYRIGFRHDFSNNNTLLASYIYDEFDGSIDLGNGFIANGEITNFIEMRQLYRNDQFNFTSGFGYIDTDLSETITSNGTTFPTRSLDTDHKNAYLYSSITYPENVNWTLGLSVDKFSSNFINRNQINPKFGVVWDLTPNTTFRAAAFRTLKRTLSSSQTLEPTQIAGFNQFFDDLNATKAWRYGIALDHKIDIDENSPGNEMFIGAELAQRELKVPRLLPPSFQLTDSEEEEVLSRLYWYWTPSDQLALSAEYQYEELDQNTTHSKTHRIPLEARTFHPSGFFSSIRASYYNQKGRFRDANGVIAAGRSDFWVVDTSVGYRALNYDLIASFEVRNLFDERFNFQDIDLENSTIDRERTIFFNMAFSF